MNKAQDTTSGRCLTCQDAMSAPTDWLGYRAHTRARSTHTLVVLVDGYEQGIESPDVDGYRWALICDEHSGVCTFETQAEARQELSHPERWCFGCQDAGGTFGSSYSQDDDDQ